MRFIDYYALLGLEKTAKMGEIRKKYREISKKIHPDILNQKKNNKEITQEEYDELIDKFKDITSGYDILMNRHKREEYDVLYEEHQREEKEKRRREEQRKRTFSNSSNVRKKQNLVDELKQAYSEIKKEEDKLPSFKKRHAIIDDNYYEENYYDDMTNPEFIFFQTKRGLVHVSIEFLFHIYKLRYIKEDTMPKYVIRNRKLAAVIVAGVMMFNIGNAISNNGEEPVTVSEVSEDLNKEEIEQYSEITLNRYYIIKSGDTLSKIAKETETPQSVIQRANNISEPNYIISGTELKIPFTINSEDLEYYTKTEKYDNSISLEEFASKNRTDINTLKRLNKEAIEETNGAYIVLSDTLTVPNFISKDELLKKKNQQANKNN